MEMDQLMVVLKYAILLLVMEHDLLVVQHVNGIFQVVVRL